MTCEICGPVMLKIKHQERSDEPSADDPLARDSSTLLSPAPQTDIMSTTQNKCGSNSIDQTTGLISSSNDHDQLLAQKWKLRAQLESFKLLQKQQEDLYAQKIKLEEQARYIMDSSSVETRQLKEQHMLLQQLQKRCQTQQTLLQQELKMQTLVQSETPFPTQPLQQISENSKEVASVPQESSQNTRTDSLPQRRGSGIGYKNIGKTLNATPSEPLDGVKKQTSVEAKGDVSLKPKKVKSNKAASVEEKPTTNKLDELAISPMLCMTKDEILKHVASLNKRIVLSSRTVTHKCRPILQNLLDHQYGWVFRDAVDPVALGLPDYFDVIKTPMHLGLVKKKLENAIYSEMEEFAKDTRLVFENAILYNGESSEVGELAQSLIVVFEKSFRAVVKGMCSFRRA